MSLVVNNTKKNLFKKYMFVPIYLQAYFILKFLHSGK